ncbi:MAG: hypothetical protein D3905_15095 [Candidatus Electrothrix sp. AS4_5]|nr:hypothetical protein [Candidatus Electrothrix gigas]
MLSVSLPAHKGGSQPLSAGVGQQNVQFPRNLREEGALYIVDEIREVNNFYRVFGNIRRLDMG